MHGIEGKPTEICKDVSAWPGVGGYKGLALNFEKQVSAVSLRTDGNLRQSKISKGAERFMAGSSRSTFLLCKGIQYSLLNTGLWVCSNLHICFFFMSLKK